MSKIYSKSGENTLILAPREGFQRPFDFGNWTEMRMGAFIGIIGSADPASDNAPGVSEVVTLNTALDRFAFGLKNDDPTTIPGQVGSNFVGLGTGPGARVENNSPFSQRMASTTAGTVWNYLSTRGATVVVNANTTSWYDGPYSVNATTAYASFLGLKFTITNRGLASQAIVVQSMLATMSGSDASTSACRTNLLAFTGPGTASASIPWNDGSIGYDIPNCFFLRAPFFFNRLRLSSIYALRIS